MHKNQKINILVLTLMLVLKMADCVIGQDIMTRLNENFNVYNIVQVDVSEAFRTTYRSGDEVNLVIPSPYSEANMTLELFPSEVISKDYSILISNDEGIKQRKGTTIIPLRGLIKGRPETRVNVVVDRNFFFACVDDGHNKYYYEPLTLYGGDQESNSIVMYKEKDVKSKAAICGSTILKRELKKTRTTDNLRAGECFEVEYAVASDYNLYQELGNSVGAVEAFVVSVTDLLNTNYEVDFNDELRHIITQQIVSTSNGGDDWLQGGAPSSIDELLEEFTSWAPGGFSASHDLGSLWTGYDLSGSTVGLAWLGTVCRSFRYNVLEYFTSNLNSLRVLAAHEIGHNYNASHDGSSGFIMSSTLSNTNTWSGTSIADINAYYESWKDSCFDNCEGGGPGGNPPVANFNFQITDDCTPGQVSFSDQSSNQPSSWFWEFEGGSPATSTQRNPVITYNNSGTFNVSLTASNISGSDVESMNNIITINDSPDAFFSYQVNGQTVNFIDLSENAASYFWEFDNGTTSTLSNPQVTYNSPGSYVVSLEITNDCGNDVIIRTVVIEQNLIAEFESDARRICSGGSVQFSDISDGEPTSWFWEFERGNPATSTERNPRVRFNAPGSYNVTLEVSNESGSDETTRINYINVDPNPLARFDFIIDGADVSFINNSLESDNYIWNFGDGSESTSFNPQHTYQESGNYEVSLIAENGCGASLEEKLVVIALGPIAGFTMEGNGNICIGESIQFLENASENTLTYNWDFGGGNPANSDQPNPLVTYNSAGLYDVSLTVSNNEGSDTKVMSQVVVVTDTPSATFTIEQNLGIVNFNSILENSEEILWEFGDGNTSILDDPVHEYLSNGTYSVVLTANNECGAETFTLDVNVLLIPEAIIDISGNREICFGESIQFVDNSLHDPASYLWTFEGGNPGTSSIADPLVVYPEPGTYNVSLMVSNDSGTDMILLEDYITINPPPEINFEYEVKANSDVIFSSSGSDINSYMWDFGDGTFSEESSPLKSYDIQGIYEVSVTATNECGSETYTLLVNNYLSPSAVFSIGNQSVCSSDEVVIENISQGQDLTFEWHFPGSVTETSGLMQPVITYSIEGKHDITLVASNPAGSDTLTIFDAVEIFFNPQSIIEYNVNALTINTINNSTGRGTDRWEFGDGSISNDLAPVYNYPQEDIYELKHYHSNACGIDSSVLQLNLYTLPTAAFSISESTGCAPFRINVENNSSSNSTSFYWIFEGGLPETSIASEEEVTFADEGQYSISLIATNPTGSDTMVVADGVRVNDLPTPGFGNIADQLVVSFEPVDSMADSYNWDFGDGEFSSEKRPVHQYISEGEYIVILETSNDCGSVNWSQSLNVNMLPTADFSFGAGSICSGDTVTFMQEASSNTTTYLWNFEGGTPSASSVANPVVNYGSPGIYGVQLIAEGIAGNDTINLDSIIIVGGSPEINAQSTIDGNIITIVDNTPDALSSSYILNLDTVQGPRFEYVANNNGIVPITLVVTNDCGSSSKDFEVVVDVFPEALIVVEQFEVCVGEVFNLPVEGNPEDSFQWELFNLDTTFTFLGVNPDFSIPNAGMYDFMLIVSNEYGSDSVYVENAIVVEDPPDPTFAIEQNGNEIMAYIVTGEQDGFSWSLGDGTILSGDTINYTYREDGIYTVTLTIENSCGTEFSSIEIEVITSGTIWPDWKNKINIFPNPVSGILTLSTENVGKTIEYQLVNLQGQTLATNILNKASSEHYIDMSSYPSSIYVVRFTDGQYVVHQKIVKVD